MVISLTFTANSYSNFDANAAAAQAAWIAPAKVFTTHFTDNIHINAAAAVMFRKSGVVRPR